MEKHYIWLSKHSNNHFHRNDYGYITLNSPKFLEIKYTILAILVLLCSLLPYSFWRKFVFPNQIERLVVITLFALIISIFLLFEIIKSSSNKLPRISKIDILLFIYISYCSCRCLIQYKNLNLEFLFEGFSIVVLYIFFRCSRYISLKYCILIFPVAGILQIFYGIKNQTGNFAPGYSIRNITGTFFNTGLWGGFVAVTLVTTLGILFIPLKSWTRVRVRFLPYLKVLLLVSVCFFVIHLFASRSRAGWCGFLAGTFYLAGSYFNLHNKFSNLSFLKRLGLTIVILCLIAFSLYCLYRFKTDSTKGRLLIWQISCQMIMDRPLFGHGIGGFQANFMEFQANYLQTKSGSPLSYLAGDNHYAFNEFVRIAVEQGLTGLSIVILLLNLLYSNSFQSKDKSIKWIYTVAQSSLLSLFVFGLFSYPMELIQFKVLIVLFIAIVSKNSYKYDISMILFFPNLDVQYQNHFKTNRILFIIIWLSFISILFISVCNYALACKKWDLALRNLNKNNDSESLEMLMESYNDLKNNGVFLTIYGKDLVITGKYKDAIKVLNEANSRLSSVANYIELGKSYRALGDFQHAKNAWLHASVMMPTLFKPEYLLSRMLFDMGDKIAARQFAIKLLHKKIKIWTPELQIMLDELNQLTSVS